MITQQTVEWCRTHDWGAHAYLVPGDIPKVAGLLDQYTKDGLLYTEETEFTSRTELRAWAGY